METVAIGFPRTKPRYPISNVLTVGMTTAGSMPANSSGKESGSNKEHSSDEW